MKNNDQGFHRNFKDLLPHREGHMGVQVRWRGVGSPFLTNLGGVLILEYFELYKTTRLQSKVLSLERLQI